MREDNEGFDLIGVGGGPGGSTLGVCKMLGVLPKVERAGFTPKTGGIWYWGKNQEGLGFDFDRLHATG